MTRRGTPARRASLLLIVIGSATAVVFAQEQPQVFRSRSDLVVLHVNVFDGKSDAVENLPESAFHIIEDSVPQTLTFFSNEDVPVAVGLVVDNSSSMLTRRGMVVAGAAAFAQSSHPEDEVFTLLFNEYVQLGLPSTVPFTQNQSLVQASIQRYPPGGKTALHDAVVAGLEHLEEASHQKHVLIVLTDGEDNASRLSEQDMLTRATRSSALVYTISTAELDSGVGNHRLLRKLSDATGGVTYRPRTENEVVTTFKEIADNIRRGYSLGYAPTNTARDGRFRRVKVMVRAPGLKNLSVNARDGYLAPGDAAAH
jgi:Ca-activated chloride channel homolog